MDTRVNFTTKMDLISVKQMQSEIAQLFEKRTKDFPCYKFCLTEYPGGLEAYNCNKITTEEIAANFFISFFKNCVV